jgi:pimeloyl-ACP methyl ester carboxylesterase
LFRRFPLPIVLCAVLAFCPAARADLNSIKLAIRNCTARLAPLATAAQSREFGLFVPADLDASRPLVVLIHGLDMDASDWDSISDLLSRDARQIAPFCYPADQPIADDVAMLNNRLARLHRDSPGLKIDIIAYSMGALVARGAIEGPNYSGGVDRLILLAPPNHGSNWAVLQPLLKCRHQIALSFSDAAWRPSWMITEGLGEAAGDLLPDSEFLRQLNSLPRRNGVRYTIIAGDENPVRRIAADCIDRSKNLIPKSCRLENLRMDLAALAFDVRRPADSSDGPVSLRSAFLDGVGDVAIVHADHETLFHFSGDQPPAAWPEIAGRLRRD